jgi:hypothetical protein
VELAERPEVRWGQVQQRERGVRKGVERTVGKASGDECVLYTSARVGLADEAGSGAMPDAAGSEASHETAKPDAVIHRYV